MRVVLTAGFDRALHAVALAELARREGHVVAAVLVVRALQAQRVRALIRQRGARSLFDAARRIVGGAAGQASDSAMEQFLHEHAIRERSLSSWCKRFDTSLQVVDDLNSPRAAGCVDAARADAVLYAGGGILRAPFLAAARGRVLNAHAGPLPAIRGMNACEWSLLLGASPAVTIHVIDEGIDTGAVLESVPIEVEPGDTIASLRGKCVVAGVMGLLRALERVAGPLPSRASGARVTRQCFTLSPVLRELLEQRLTSRGEA